MVYYAFGFLYGKDIIKIIESQSVRCWLLLAIAIVIFSSACVIKSFVELSHYPKIFLEYIETFALIIALMYLFKYTCKFVLLRPLKFFGPIRM